jgi:hypothetical protein
LPEFPVWAIAGAEFVAKVKHRMAELKIRRARGFLTKNDITLLQRSCLETRVMNCEKRKRRLETGGRRPDEGRCYNEV